MSDLVKAYRYIHERSICLPSKERNERIKAPVIELLTDIVNTSYTGKEVIIFQQDKWKHYWIPPKGKVTVKSKFDPSSSLLEMIRRDQITLVRR